MLECRTRQLDVGVAPSVGELQANRIRLSGLLLRVEGAGEAEQRPAVGRVALEILAIHRFGLGGPEIGVPRPQFAPHFDRARAAGLHSVPHAGETTGPETIWDALRDLLDPRIRNR